jgi:hypothetical protein
MKNIYIFDIAPVSIECKFSENKAELIAQFVYSYPAFQNNFHIDKKVIHFLISNDTEISEHNNIVDFLESNVNNGRLFNGLGISLPSDFYQRLYEIFSDSVGNVMFNNGDYECNLKTIGKFDSSHYFELKADGLNWREDDDYEEDDYDDDDY